MNDELISKAALKKEIQDVVLTVADTPLSNDYTSKLIMKMGELFRKKIDEAPTIDAVEVVRCRDCVRWGTGHVFETECIKECQYGHYLVGNNGYCIYGERKMDAEVKG